MARIVLAVAAVSWLVELSAAPALAAGPYVDGTFRGRIAYSADGNHNDPDDWAASPLALAIIAQAGLKAQLVHFDYNCILPQTNAEWERIHAESVLGATKYYSYDMNRFHDCQRDLDAAIASIARAIDASSAEDPLYFIVAGPMEVPFRGIEKSDPQKRQHVYCISHSRWNDGFAPAYKFTHTKRSVIPSGINWVQIADQNRLLSLSPYGKPGTPQAFARYHWMRDSHDERVRFLWERMLISTRPDPSDAGMAYFLVTGDEQADPEKLRRLLDDKTAPLALVGRNRIRLEAENFRELVGFRIEDRNDRTASHRLTVKGTGDGPRRIQTPFNEPHAPASGRFDVTFRFRSQVSGIPVAILVNDAPLSTQGESGPSEQGWQSTVYRDVALASGDTLAVVAENPDVELDYVQLDLR